MRRSLILLGLGLGVFAAAAFVGFLTSSRLVPERVRQVTETTLGQLLGTPVEIEETHLYLRFGLAVEARGISAWPGPDGPAFTVRRGLLRLDLLPLLFGEVRPRWLRLEQPRLVVERDPQGAVVSPFAWRPWSEDPEPGGPAYELGRRSIDSAVGAVLGLPLPSPHLEIVGGELISLQASAPDAPSLELRGLEARVSRSDARDAGRLDLRTDLVRRGREGGRLELEAEARRSGETQIQLSLDRFELGSLGSWAPPLRDRLLASGRVSGDLELRMERDKPHRLDGELQLSGLTLQLPRATDPPLVLKTEVGSLRASLLLTDERLELWSGQVRSRDLQLGLEGTLELPPRAESRARVVARAADLELTDLADILGWLPEGLRSEAESLLARVEAGRVEELELRLATPLGKFDGIGPEGRLGLLRDLELRGRIEAGRFRISEAELLDEVRAQVLFDGDRLDLRDADARWNERKLPRLNAAITGVSHLLPFGDLRCQPPAHVEPLPGREALRDWLEARREPDSPETWSRLSLEADWIRHPLLGCGVEHARAIVTPSGEGFSFEIQQAIWAGAPVKASGSFQRGSREALNVSLALGPAWEPVTEAASELPWASGRFKVVANRFGPWSVAGASGAFEGRHASLHLSEARLQLVPGGELRADLTLDLGDAERVPYQIHFRVEDVSVADLAAARELPRLADGRLTGAGSVAGRLRGTESSLAGASGEIVLLARDGVLHRELPLLLAIAVASEGLNPLAERKEIPFDGIDAVLELEDGVLRSRSLTLQGPWLRAMASGQIDAAHEPHPAESVVALFFFRNLDRMISRLPLLNRVLLGEDENLINAYFAVSGPLGEPQARLIPVKMLSAGPASFVLEGFPAFVRGGLSRLRAVLLPGGGGEPTPSEERIGS